MSARLYNDIKYICDRTEKKVNELKAERQKSIDSGDLVKGRSLARQIRIIVPILNDLKTSLNNEDVFVDYLKRTFAEMIDNPEWSLIHQKRIENDNTKF